jgi:hypothetical protein
LISTADFEIQQILCACPLAFFLFDFLFSLLPIIVLQEAAECLGEELIKACMDLKINEISSYDRNGFAGGERMQAFEIAISRHGFLPR